jgi:hypothetical protein
LFCVVFGVAGLSLLRNRPLAFHFLPDEWYERGVNLRLYGTLGVGEQALTFRPPGYAAFVAAILWFLPTPQAPPPAAARSDPEALRVLYGSRGPTAIYWVQALLLAGAATLSFAWASHFLPRAHAFGAGLLFGTAPYTVILASAVHYEILHLFGVVAGGLLLQRAVEAQRRAALHAFGAGLCWGLTTLVRPLTLILPAFALVGFLVAGRRRWWSAVFATAALCLGMLGVLAPWSWRNYALTGRLIPVNSQSWTALWASTVRKLERSPDHLLWRALWLSPESREVQATVRERPFDRYPDAVALNLGLEDAFRARALRNIRSRPQLYLHNVATGLATIALDLDSALIKVFEYVQRPGVTRMPPGWFLPGHPQDFHPSAHARSFTRLVAASTLLAALGLLAALRRGERAALVPGLVLACLGVAHALTWMDLRYYYVKLPFVFMLAGLGVHQARGWALRLPGLRRACPVSWLASALLGAWALYLTSVVLFLPR